MKMIDPEQIIIVSPPGTAIYCRLLRPDPHIDFLIREESARIATLKNPVIVFRTDLFPNPSISPVTVLFKCGTEIYETWWNYYQDSGQGPDIFQEMADQTDLALHFYGDSLKVEKSVVVRNSLAPFFRDAIARIQKLPAWSMRDFDHEREKIYQKYPSVLELWDAIYRRDT